MSLFIKSSHLITGAIEEASKFDKSSVTPYYQPDSASCFSGPRVVNMKASYSSNTRIIDNT